MNLVIATRNAHKLEEIRAIFNFDGLVVTSAFDYPEVPDVVEDGTTFAENAMKKAVALATATGQWTMADDSGLEVEALNGAPGVYSARYAGEPSDAAANNRKLLAALAEREDRQARFRTVIALSDPAGDVRVVEGICPGIILREERGTHGFGYDPLFVPDGYVKTFAVLSAAEKNRISHRARALQAAEVAWRKLLG